MYELQPYSKKDAWTYKSWYNIDLILNLRNRVLYIYISYSQIGVYRF